MIANYLRSALFFYLLCAAAGLSGCGLGTGTYRDFENDDPKIRLAAIRRAGKALDKKAVRYLVECLMDDEADVRVFAIVALRKITGQSLGYQHYAPRERRKEAVLKWRQWLKQREKTTTQPAQATQPAKS